MLQGFKDFILRGNVIELAVAVVIGSAFNVVVEKVVETLINPIIGMVFQADSLDRSLVVDLPGGGHLLFGAFIGAVINFIIVAAVVYFVFVLPMNKFAKPAPEAPAGPTQEELLTEIRDLLAAPEARRTPTVPGTITPDDGAPHKH